MSDNQIEPVEVIQAVERYVERELSDLAKYDNRTPFDQSGVWSLHQLARDIYARGVEDGTRQEAERQRQQQQRRHAMPSSNEPRDQLAGEVASRALEKMYVEWGITPGLPTPVVAAYRAAAAFVDEGWRPPPRVIDTAEAIAHESTGTVIRSRQGDIGSIDHGPHGEWTGPATLVHLLDPGVGGGLSVADLSDPELASTFPYLVLWEPEEVSR